MIWSFRAFLVFNAHFLEIVGFVIAKATGVQVARGCIAMLKRSSLRPAKGGMFNQTSQGVLDSSGKARVRNASSSDAHVSNLCGLLELLNAPILRAVIYRGPNGDHIFDNPRYALL